MQNLKTTGLIFFWNIGFHTYLFTLRQPQCQHIVKYMARKVLIIGGTRYFGKRLVQLCMDNKDEVTIATRGLTADSFGDTVERLHCDRMLYTEMQSTLKDRDWDIIFDQNCYSSDEAHIATRIFAGRVKKYIHTSTQSTYIKTGEVSEKDFDPYNYPIERGSRTDFDYGEAKRGAEAVFFQNASFPVAAVRFPIVLGVDDYTKRLEFHIDRIQQQKPIVIGNMNSMFSSITSEDAAKFLFWISTKKFIGPINACSPQALPISQVIKFIEEITGKKASITSSGEDADRTKFVGDESRHLSVKLAISEGFQFQDIKIWLPELIRAIYQRDHQT
jgi:nucleoside-diphosphate-sugar epimerase